MNERMEKAKKRLELAVEVYTSDLEGMAFTDAALEAILRDIDAAKQFVQDCHNAGLHPRSSD